MLDLIGVLHTGLEVLSKLCTVEGNDDVLYTELDERVYESILKSLIVPDVEVYASVDLVSGEVDLMLVIELPTSSCLLLLWRHCIN